MESLKRKVADILKVLIDKEYRQRKAKLENIIKLANDYYYSHN